MSKSCYLFVLFVLLAVSGFGQDINKVEKDIYFCSWKIEYWGSNQDVSKYDSLTKYNNMLTTTLIANGNKNAGMMTSSFKLIHDSNLDIKMHTSADGMLRVYNWNTLSGGTMQFFNNVFQYKSGNGVKAYAQVDTDKNGNGDPECAYDTVYTLKANNKTYYLLSYYMIGSSRDRAEGIEVYAIENGKVDDSVKLIKTKSGLHNSISYYYDIFAGGSPDEIKHSIYFDGKTNEIYIPVVLEGGKMTKNYIKYKFTGEYFEKE